MATRCPACGQRILTIRDACLWAVGCGLALALILFAAIMSF